MRFFLCAWLLVSLVMLPGSAARSDEITWREKIRRKKYKHHEAWWANRVWPEPWIGPDRAAVRSPFAIMVAKGWQEQNTLTDDHFEPESADLSETGRLKVADILINSPPQHRTIFVEKTWEGPTAEQRMKSIEKYVETRMPDLGPVSLAETIRKRPGTAGDATDYTLRQWQATQPDPRLPASTSSSQSGSGGSSSGSGASGS